MKHTVVFGPSHTPTADEAARSIYGMSSSQLVRAILENKDGKYDRLYLSTKPTTEKETIA